MVKSTKMKFPKMNFPKLDKFNIKFTKKQLIIISMGILILVLILAFRKLINFILQKIVVFLILFLLLLALTKNILITIVGSLLIFLLINLIFTYNKTIESFEDIKEKEKEKEIEKKEDEIKKYKDVLENQPGFIKNIFEDEKVKTSAKGIQDLLGKLNGGIKLKEDDLIETKSLGVDSSKYADDKTPTPLKIAQKEAFELIDTVNALNDTITTLSPVLQEGKKLMDMFQNISL